MFWIKQKGADKRGQVTLFIIIAIVIVALFLLFILFSEKTKKIISPPVSIENPLQYISQCTEESAREAINTILPQGGYLEPKLYEFYRGNKVAFLCYNENFYDRCINQNPDYIMHIEEEIKKQIEPKVEQCFWSLKTSYEKKGVATQIQEAQNLDIEIIDKKIIVNIKREFSFSEKDKTNSYNEFKSVFNSPVYKIARVAQEIVNQEAKFCYSEYLGYQLLYPWVEITKTDINGKVKIYTIKDRQSGKKLNIAIRSCALPAGI